MEDLVGSETIELPGKEPMTMKAYLGNQFVGEMDDNHITLAPERYIKEDFRLVKRDRGTFVTEISPSGQHGDTFDSHKNASYALESSQPFIYQSVAKKPSHQRADRVNRKEVLL